MGLGRTGSRFRTIGGSTPIGLKVAASLTTALAGTNNDLKISAQDVGGFSGAAGNAVTVAYVNPGNNGTLDVGVSGNAITVTLATNGTAVITSTAAQVRDAINSDADSRALVVAENAAGNDGTGLVTAMGATALTGGVDWTNGNAGRGFGPSGPRFRTIT